MASSNVVAEYWAWQKKQIQPRPMFALHDDGNIVPIENKVKKAAPLAPKVVSNNPQEVHTNLSRSLEYFARHALRLKPKEGGGLTNSFSTVHSNMCINVLKNRKPVWAMFAPLSSKADNKGCLLM